MRACGEWLHSHFSSHSLSSFGLLLANVRCRSRYKMWKFLSPQKCFSNIIVIIDYAHSYVLSSLSQYVLFSLVLLARECESSWAKSSSLFPTFLFSAKKYEIVLFRGFTPPSSSCTSCLFRLFFLFTASPLSDFGEREKLPVYPLENITSIPPNLSPSPPSLAHPTFWGAINYENETLLKVLVFCLSIARVPLVHSPAGLLQWYDDSVFMFTAVVLAARFHEITTIWWFLAWNFHFHLISLPPWRFFLLVIFIYIFDLSQSWLSSPAMIGLGKTSSGDDEIDVYEL